MYGMYDVSGSFDWRYAENPRRGMGKQRLCMHQSQHAESGGFDGLFRSNIDLCLHAHVICSISVVFVTVIVADAKRCIAEEWGMLPLHTARTTRGLLWTKCGRAAASTCPALGLASYSGIYSFAANFKSMFSGVCSAK